MMMCADGSEGSIRRTDRERMTGIDNCLSAKKAGKSVRRRTAIFGATPWRLLAVLSMLIALFLCAAASREGSYGSAEAAASSTESDSDDEAAASWLTRRLSKNRKHKHNEEEPIDYTEFSCDSLPTMRAKFAHNRVYKFSPCEFAHRCNDGEGIIFPSLFCGGGDVDVYDAPSESNGGSRSGGSEQETDGKRTRTTDYLELRHVPLLLFLSFSLLLLFRLLQSTTDEFFSPGLEMFSLQLGLPPRFAGVTLLALGNGAPDVAATMNAIINDTRHGYEMALGELTGTSMFVTSVILGTIVSLSGSGGGVTSGTDEKGEKENDGSSNADSKGVAVASAAPSKGNEDCQQGSRAQQSSVADAVSAAPTGVSCRGPLLRDIAVLVLVCVVSMSYLRRGVIDYGFVYSLLAIYGAYVLLVLVADCYHIFYHVPYVAAERRGSSELVNDLLLKEEDDLGAIDDDQDKMDGNTEQIKTSGDKLHSNGGSSEEPRANEKTPLLSTAFNRSNTAPQRCQSPVPHLNPLHVHNSTVHNHTIGDTFFEAMSNYSCSEPVIVSNRSHESDVERGDMVALPQNNQAADSPCQRNHAPASSAAGAAAGGASCGWAPMQDDGTEPLVIFHPHHAVHPHHGPGGLLFLRSKSTAGSSPRASQYLASRDRRQFSWSPDDNDHGGDSGTRAKVESSTQKLRKSSSCDASSSNATVSLSARQSAAPETMALHRNKDAMQISYRSGGADDASVEVSDQVSVDSRNDAVEYMKRRRPNSWSDAWSTNLTEFRDHWNDFFVDIYFNPENSVLDVILLSVELPFTIMRKLSNPVPCDGYYCRPLVALSMALSPIWLWYYIGEQFETDIFSSSVGYAIATASVGTGLIVIRYSPGGDGPMDLYLVVPLTLYGFAISATWLDAIADKLVDLLTLFGILLEIPTTVLGLTVLAFGNSLQDLVANVTMSKKGLSTMATTACFASPIFNLCVGLGFGFWVLLKSTGENEIHVTLPRNIATGFLFTVANCGLVMFSGVVVGKGVLGRGYGYLACGLYLVYVITSLYI